VEVEPRRLARAEEAIAHGVADCGEAAADPSQELAAVLIEYAGWDPVRTRAISAAYHDAGGPGRVECPADFAMPIAQLSHIVEEASRRWLASTTDAERADNEGWVREFLDRPVTPSLVEALLSAVTA
jgi:hypothetical protein